MKLKERFGERYAVLNRALLSASTARDKIFHGQQTGRKYSRDELIELVEFIQEWCKIFGEFAAEAFGYDGFSGANSLYKADNEKLTAQVDSVVAKNGWEAFIKSM